MEGMHRMDGIMDGGVGGSLGEIWWDMVGYGGIWWDMVGWEDIPGM